MNTSTNKKIVCVKDIPSNIIEEAIFILKTDMTEGKNKKLELKREEIIIKETEELVKEYSEELIKNEIEKKENDYRKINDLKMKLVLGSILLACVCYLVSLLI